MSIDTDIPPPSMVRSGFHEALLRLQPGQSTADLIKSRADQCNLLSHAKYYGIKITTKKLKAGGWRCWRLS